MIVERAAATTVVKLGSLVIAAVMVSSADRLLPSKPNSVVAAGGCGGGTGLCPAAAVKPYIGNGVIVGTGGGISWRCWSRPAAAAAAAAAPGDGACVRSRVMVGNGAEADSVAPAMADA
jgi:hypothetical protein